MYTAPAQCWVKFKPIIDEYRGSGRFSKEHYRDFEFLASEIAKVVGKTDPLYRDDSTYFRPEAWVDAFLKPKTQ